MAISVDPVERNLDLARRHHLDFALLADPDRKAVAGFGVLHPGAAPGGGDIARPATFIIQGGVIRWRDLTRNWRVRPQPTDLLRVLADL